LDNKVTELIVSVKLVIGNQRRCWLWQIWREPSASYLLPCSISSFAPRTPIFCAQFFCWFIHFVGENSWI